MVRILNHYTRRIINSININKNHSSTSSYNMWYNNGFEKNTKLKKK